MNILFKFSLNCIYFQISIYTWQHTSIQIHGNGLENKLLKNFTYLGENKLLKNFTYLGIVLSTGGSFSEAQSALSGQALKAIFQIEQISS